MVDLAKAALKQSGDGTYYELLTLNGGVVMVDLLPALEQFRDAMKQKIS